MTQRNLERDFVRININDKLKNERKMLCEILHATFMHSVWAKIHLQRDYL